jgi:hypothetical protein
MVQATSGEGGKGSERRPCLVSRAEYDLRWEYGQGGMTLDEFNKRLKEIRNAKVPE